MKRKILLFLLSFVLWTPQLLYAQNFQVSGTVVSSEDGEALMGVSVIVKGGGGNGTVTDLDGKFELSVANGKTLVFSYIGYTSQEKVIKGDVVLDIKMGNDPHLLDEVVAIGYGSMKKSDLTGAVASISADKLKQTPLSGLDQALQGKAAGVTVNANSGQPGAEAVVRIRGIGTVNNSSPLYVVDGVIVENISFLNPNDIAATEVLKDASSTAIYGSRGANGVILVTTKRGSDSPKGNITVDMYWGVQNRWKKLDLLHRDDFANVLSTLEGSDDYLRDKGFNKWVEAYRTGKKSPYFPQIKTDAYPQGFDYSTQDTDWQEEVFEKNAPIQNYHISFDGGSKTSTYAISGGYFDQKGTIMGSYYNRLTLRVNTSHKVKPWLKIGENLSFMRSTSRNAMNNNMSPGASILSAAMAMAPWDPTHYPTGSTSYKSPTGEIRDLSGQISASSNFKNVVNPYSMVEKIDPKNIAERWVGDVYMEVTPIEGLIFRSDVSLDISNVDDRLFKYDYEYSSFDKNTDNYLEIRNARYATVIFENTLTYAKKVKKHDFTFLLGTTTQETNYKAMIGSGKRILHPTPENWLLSKTTKEKSIRDEQGRTRMLSFLSRVNYQYDNKYMITANFRMDGSSKFPENIWGYFPSMSLGWRVSEEPWMKDFANLDHLKLRAGWGQIGNDKIPSDSFITTMFNAGPTYVDYVLGKDQIIANGAGVLTYAGTAGRWETTNQWNVGVDFGLFKGLVSGTLDVFLKDTKDVLIPVKAPAHVGNRYDAMKNAGTVRNTGLELSLEHRNKVGDINLAIGGNMSIIKNEFKDLNGGQKIYANYENILLTNEGLPINTFWGYEYGGVFKTNEDLLNNINKDGKEIQPGVQLGDARIMDLNHDGKIDDADKTNLGNPFPWLTYGFNISADWKGFDLQLFLQGIAGNEIFNAARINTEGRGTSATLSSTMLDVWTTQNPNGNVPNPNGVSNQQTATSRFIEDGSYLRLKNVQIGYTLPKQYTKRLLIERCRIYVSASNLFTVTKYTGYDPEVGGGVDFGNYPQARTFLMGVTLNF